MTTHPDVLARIEAEIAAAGATVEELDARIAAELGVPVDYYFAYLLVWGAVERYRDTVLAQQPLPLPDVPDPRGWALALAEDIGWTASTIYRDTAGNGHGELNAAAGRVLAAALQLRGCLTPSPPARDSVATACALTPVPAAR